MERDHCGVDKMMAVQEVGGLERSLGGGNGRVLGLFGFSRGYEGEGRIQVTPRRQGVADGKSLFIGEDHDIGCQKPMKQAGAAMERGVGLGREKSRRS